MAAVASLTTKALPSACARTVPGRTGRAQAPAAALRAGGAPSKTLLAQVGVWVALPAPGGVTGQGRAVGEQL